MTDTKIIIVLLVGYFAFVLFRDWTAIVQRVRWLYFGRDEMMRRYFQAMGDDPSSDMASAATVRASVE